jgi:hypothetical protein
MSSNTPNNSSTWADVKSASGPCGALPVKRWFIEQAGLHHPTLSFGGFDKSAGHSPCKNEKLEAIIFDPMRAKTGRLLEKAAGLTS